MSFSMYSRWLEIVYLAFAVFGVLLALLSPTALFEAIFHANVDPVFFGNTELPEASRGFRNWIYAVLGSSCAAVGLLMFCIVRFCFRKREAWARNGLIGAISVWFVIDQTASLLSGVWFNVAFNSIFFAIIVIPLLATWRNFQNPQCVT